MKKFLNKGRKVLKNTAKVVGGTYFLLNMALGQGFSGTLTTTEGDTLRGARVIAKRGDMIVSDSLSDSNGVYYGDWSNVSITKETGIIGPSTKLLTIWNNVTDDGNIYPIIDGSVENIKYDYIDLRGRNVTKSPSLAKGVYFLQIFDKTTNEFLGAKRFQNLRTGPINAKFRQSEKTNTPFKKAGKTNGFFNENADSLIYSYENEDMLIQTLREQVTVPNEGFELRNQQLIRERRLPEVEVLGVPINPTIEQNYLILINAFNRDFDADIASLDLEHITGDSINYYFNGADTFMVSPHTKGYHLFRFNVQDTQGAGSIFDIELDVTSDTYKILLTKLFNGLGNPREGLDVSLKNKEKRTGSSGIVTFEFPTDYLTITDSIEIKDNILGNLQDGTGPFGAMKVKIKRLSSMIYSNSIVNSSMKTNKEIRDLFNRLSAGDQSVLLEELLQTHELKGAIMTAAHDDVSSTRIRKPCPHCKSEKVYKRGKQKGVQMYKCNDCNKWYRETTGTPLYGIKLKWKWQAYLRCMEQGMSIKKTAQELGLSIQTSFDWRHKILSTLDSFTPEHLSGVVECDELELPISNKGEKQLERKPRKRGSDFKRNQGENQVTVIQVITAIERNGEKYLKAVASKRLTKEEIAIGLEGKLEDGVTLITDKHPSYKSYVKDHPSIKHKTIIAKEHVDKKNKNINLQKVNNTHAQLRKFLMPFNGVSSKYLQNYLNWFAYSDKLRQTKTTLKQWLVASLLADQSYELFLCFKHNAVLIRT